MIKKKKKKKKIGHFLKDFEHILENETTWKVISRYSTIIITIGLFCKI